MKKKIQHNVSVEKKKGVETTVHDFVEKKLVDGSNKQAADDVDAKKLTAGTKKKRLWGRKRSAETKESIVDPVSLSKEKETRIMNELTKIYENPDGSMPDMAAFKARRHSGIFRGLVIVLCIGLLVLGGSFLYALFVAPKVLFSQDDVLFTVSGDTSLQIGDKVQYRLRVKNAQEADLLHPTIEVHYPAGFVFDQASITPMTSTTNVWQFDTIAAGGEQSVDITGTLYGGVGEEQSLRAFFRYQPSNFSSEFQKVERITTVLPVAPFEVVLNVPEFLAAGAAGELVISLDPKQGVEMKQLRVVVEAGKQFVKKDSQPESTQINQFAWDIDILDTARDIVLQGVFSEQAADSAQTVTVKVLGWPTPDRSGEGFVYAEIQKDIPVKKTDLVGRVILNGSEGKSAVQPGEKMNVSVVVKNIGSVPVSHVEATLAFDMPALGKQSILDWNNVIDEADGTIVGTALEQGLRRGALTWNSAQTSALKSMKPGDEVVLDVVMPIKTGAHVDLTQFTTHVGQVTLEVSYGKEGEKKLFTSAPIEVVINSDVTLEVQDDITEQGGKELHTITWLLSNTFHELKDVSLTAQLFGDVTLDTDQMTAPAGNVVYQSEEKKLTWKIDTMPLSVDVLALQFPVLINKKNPTQKNLTSKVEIIATDTVTGEKIVEIGDEVLLLAQ